MNNTVTYLSHINGRFDEKAGVIRGVSVITEGTARGHDLKIDGKTVEQMLGACQASNSGRVKTKLNHRSGIESVFGYLSEFRIEGPKLVADLTLLKKHKDYGQTMEQLREMPESIGLSVAFTGKPEVCGDASKAARVERIISADLVPEPAANPTGLFEEPLVSEEVDTPDKNEMSDINQVLQAIGDLSSRLDSYDERFDSIEGSLQGEPEGQEDGVTEEEIAEAIEALREQGYDDGEIEGIISSEIDELYGEESEEENSEAYEDAPEYRNGGTDLDPNQERVGSVAEQASAAQPYGEDAGDSDGGGEFARLEQIVTNLEAKIAGQQEAADEAALETQLGEIRSKVVALASRNDELENELDAARHALNTGTGRAVETGAPGQDITLGEGAFEDTVRHHLDEGKTKGESVALAAKENREQHLDWLRRSGVIG